MDVGRDVEISGELNLKKQSFHLCSGGMTMTNLPAKPSREAAAFSFSKKLSNLEEQS